jgi:hypothetical protein
MRPRTFSIAYLLTATVAAACGNASNDSDDDFGFMPMTGGVMTGDGPATSGGSGSDSAQGTLDDTGTGPGDTGDETGEPPPNGPQARATIVIGESHDPGGANATAVLNASFVPNAETVPTGCTTDVGGCTVAVPPVCPIACLVGEVCQYDDACVPTCQATCSLACPAGEVCYFPVPDVPACRAIETFDAGRLDFVGTKVPVTLFPPYVLPPGYDGTLTNPGSVVTATASGAIAAGFGPFEVMVTTAESLFTTIDQILPTDSFGLADLVVTWVPGVDDDIVVNLVVSGALGGTGTVTCEGDDATGTLSIPRPAIDAAVAEMDTATSMFLTVTRRHLETSSGHPTVGVLLEEDLPPEGTVDFVFTSSESATLLPM